jgi:hypothetical protein
MSDIDTFDDRALVLPAGTAVEFYSNGTVYVRKRGVDSLIVQAFKFTNGKWECHSRTALDDDAAIVTVLVGTND